MAGAWFLLPRGWLFTLASPLLHLGLQRIKLRAAAFYVQGHTRCSGSAPSLLPMPTAAVLPEQMN